MKVGKETTFGLLQALDEYGAKEDKSEQEKETLQALIPLNELEGVKVTIVQDEAGRAIFRARIQLDPSQTNITAKEVVTGEIAIYTRDYGVRQGYFDIDPRPLQGDDIYVIKSKINELLGGN
jgi:L-seryl-tRNA(Ser) seleniumtransferase